MAEDAAAKLELIKEAILGRRTIFGLYSGFKRELCVSVLGTKNGKVNILAYQIGGESSSGTITRRSPDNWRCMELAKLSNITFSETEWFCEPGSGTRQGCIGEVVLEVPCP